MEAKLTDLLLSRDATLLEAMAAIEEGGQGLVFVCDDSDAVVGTLADGDIRRAILGGASLQARGLMDAVNRDFASAGPQMGRSEALDLMKALDIRQIPILDPKGRLVGLHLLRELLGAIDRPNWLF